MTAPVDPSIAALVDQLASADVNTRAAAAESLCRSGEAASPVAAALVNACADDESSVVEWIVAALEEIGAPPADSLAALAGLAGSPHPLVAYWAITLLGRCGPEAAAAVAPIAARLAPGGPIEVRQRAAWALGKMGSAAAPARAVLETASTDADPRLARLAGEALAALGG